eukprot:symbB.v1.2.001920.t1/scaffold55.1/size374282/2
MSSDWQKLADLWYRKLEVYPAQWSDDPDRLHLCVAAGAPYGGPVATVRNEHVFQPVKGSLQTHLQTWTAAGRLIQSSPWVHTGLVTMGWSAQETLVCVFESGLIRTYSVMCEPLHVFTIDERIKSEGGAIMASLWPTGVAVLTRKFSLFVNTSLTRSGDACHRLADLRAPLCICALPPPAEDSLDVQIIVGTAEGPVLMVDRQGARDIGFTDGPFMAFSLSNSGRLLACLSTKGVFKVVSVSDELKILDVANIEQIRKPKQMVWCGDDCIALYLVAPDHNGTALQHVLFVGGPQNDWIPYQYDSPLHLVSECDGCRVMGTHKIEFVQRVPQSVESIFSIGSYDPPALLLFALEKYEKGDESLRPIKDKLADAVSSCLDAALCEETPAFINLLKAASFGRHFLTETPGCPDRHREVCRSLRICRELRKGPIEIPITPAQLEKLGMAGLSMRLAQRHFHLLAIRICEWVGHASSEQVLFHWACEKIRGARGSPQTDEQLCQTILEKFQRCPGIGFAEVARVAAEMYRPHLATLLLNHEPRSHAQVQVLVQLSREGDEKDRDIMLRLALDKAARSWDPDLMHSALSAACLGDPCERSSDIQSCARLIKEKLYDLQVVGDLVTKQLISREQFDRARMLNDLLDRKRLAAFAALHRVFRQTNYDERTKLLRFSKDLFGINDPSATDAEKSSMQFMSQACVEEMDLLAAQLSLEEKANSKSWGRSSQRFLGLPLVTTLVKLLELGEVREADELRMRMKVTDKRYWRIKIRGLANAGNFEELNAFAIVTSPIGYEVFVETFLKHGRQDFALALVPKVKSCEQQAQYYQQMGLHDQAQRARTQGQERSGAGRLLNILGVGRLSLYILCCPNPEIATPQQAGCPVEFQDAHCCTDDTTNNFLKLANVAPEDEDHYEAMKLLWYFLRDIDVLNLDAWHFFVKGFAEAANFQMFEFKSQLHSLHLEAREMALKFSRQIAKSMHRIEGFQQFCLWHFATRMGKMVTEVAPESCEMSELLEQYKAAAANHDFLVYWLIPQLPTLSPDGLTTSQHGTGGSTVTIALQVVCVGAWAQRGFVTLRSLLQHRSGRPLRIFVISDLEGWNDWLAHSEARKEEMSFQDVSFERIDFYKLMQLERYRKEYPSNCRFEHDIERAMLARVLCHELLPDDIDWVISMDLGDVLVLDDILELWELRQHLKEHFFAISYAAALGEHLNAGLVLYHLHQMRHGNFTGLILRAATWSMKVQEDGICPRDQNILNVLKDQEFLSTVNIEDFQIMKILPCRWSLFPVVDWHPAWSMVELWQTEIFQRLRYPGVVSTSQVEFYCPDPVDLLMAYAFLPISNRQRRVGVYAEQEGGDHLRHCHPLRIGSPCCKCGEVAALLHVAGDLKGWPAMSNLLGHEGSSLESQRWWGGELRQRKLQEKSEEMLFDMAKGKGLNVLVPLGSSWCRTLHTDAFHLAEYHGNLKQSSEIRVQTTAHEFQLLMVVGTFSLQVALAKPQMEVRCGSDVFTMNLKDNCFHQWISMVIVSKKPWQLEVCDMVMDLPEIAISVSDYSLQMTAPSETSWAICDKG